MTHEYHNLTVCMFSYAYCTTVCKSIPIFVVYLLCLHELFTSKFWVTGHMIEFMYLNDMLVGILFFFFQVNFLFVLFLLYLIELSFILRASLGFISMSDIKPIFLVILYKMTLKHTSYVARTFQICCCTSVGLFWEDPIRVRATKHTSTSIFY